MRLSECDGAHISELGKIKLEGLILEIRKIIEDSIPKIFTSISPRAIQSANIIAEAFKTDAEQDKILFNNVYERDESILESILELINPDLHEVVILVTHIEFTEWFPKFFALRVWNRGGVSEVPLYNGESWFIDCKEEIMKIISP